LVSVSIYVPQVVITLVLDNQTAFYKHTPHAGLRFDPATAEGPFYPPFDNVIGAGYYFHNDVVRFVSPPVQRLGIRMFDFDLVHAPARGSLFFLK